MVKRLPRVSIIDDNHDVADSMAHLISDLGAATQAVYDGLSGVESVEQFDPDIIFLDIEMPGVDGCETARRIRKSGHCHPCVIVALTGWSRDEDYDRTCQAGFDFYLVKSASIGIPEDLRAACNLAMFQIRSRNSTCPLSAQLINPMCC